MSPKQKRPTSEATGPFSEGGLFRLLQMVVAILLVARWLVPPESSVLGATLGITQLWFAAALLWAWDAYRREDFRVRWGWIDAGLWIVILGHGLSMGKVFFQGGDRRAALNLFWEWAGLGVSFFLLRQTLRSREDSRRLVAVLIAGAVMLAGFGIWQHYVELPRIARNYERIAREIHQPESLSSNELGQLQRELQDMGVPANPVSRTLWENRLRSTEPFATFALANTLGGFLAAWLFVLVDGLWLGGRSSQPGSRFSWRGLGWLVCIVVMGFCLVLTKSRTAWVGFVAGFLVWMTLRGAGTWKLSRRWLFAGAGLLAVVVGFFLVAGLSGGFDRQVISEAPKSLAYRVQYWTGAWEVVKDQPWLGTGPGNFRQHYLHHKLPESSEEIADPHNWILDLWTSGGLLALVGFLVFLILVVRAAGRLRKTNDSRETPSAGVSAWELGGGAAFLLMLSVLWVSGEWMDGSLLGLFALWVATWMILRRMASRAVPTAGMLAGGVALMVHLLGAGGMEMPAVVQTLLVFAVLLSGADWGRADETGPPVRSTAKGVMGVAALSALAFGLCLVTATAPVWNRTLYVLSGDAALSHDRNPAAAQRWYEQANEADPYSPEPVERLGELAFQRWLGSSSPRDFEEAVRYGTIAIKRDPVSNTGYRRLGQWSLERAKRQESSADAKTAAEYFSEAVLRYPNFAPLRAELAVALDRAGQSKQAAAEAELALELDKINHDAGHQDKFLPEELVETLQRIAEDLE